MPTYRYTCDQCGHTEDLFLKMSEFTLTRDCPQCSTPAAQKKVPVTNINSPIFKGDGYYQTDFKNK